MAAVDSASCPKCQAPPSALSITEELVANPIGSFSLSGAQTKVTASARPVLACSACDLRVVGEYDPDGHHANFPSP